MYEDILAKVEGEHLIRIVDRDIYLTRLGQVSLKEGKHYQFFSGTQDVYEHSMIKSKMPMALLMFPFSKTWELALPSRRISKYGQKMRILRTLFTSK